ncbi:unnamed protein product [Schistosoma curassoni]|uniref:DUF6451 domain-containing protein n=1 Tax=Schistosoma curassoni TaxID=6186 RepID=A0A183JPG6_9TREM|nr:unnamed protein product [Schistosoma curassoni]
MHKGKGKILRYNTACTNSVTINGEDLEDVKTFTYLGRIIDEHGGSDADVKAWVGKARAAYLQLKNIWNSKQLSTNTKVRIYNTNVKTVLLCSCGDSYIGRTTRQINQQMSEHPPSWFVKGWIKTTHSSILAYLIDSGHNVDKSESFRVIYRIPPSLSSGVLSRLLHIAEAVGIRIFNHNLCVQKKFVTHPIPSMT